MAITRAEHSASDLRGEAAATSDAAAARRMLAVALVLEGQPRAVAARFCGMDRQTLCNWVHRYNAEGLAGLSDRHGGGPARRLSAEQEAQVSAWVRAGPDLAVDGVVRWRRADLQAKIAKRFGVELHERSVGKLLRRQGFRRMSVRPRHPAADAEAQEAQKKFRRAGRRRDPRERQRQTAGTLLAGTKRGSGSKAA